MNSHGWIAWIVLAALVVLPGRGWVYACDAPVYRYALEKWGGGQFEAYLFYQRVLPADVRDSIENLKTNPDFPVTVVDVTRGVGPGREKLVYQAYARGKTMPLLVVVGPLADGGSVLPDLLIRDRVGPLARGLVDSPARQDIAGKILAGDRIVWTVVGRGDPAQDEAFVTKLRGLLDQAEREVLAPELKNGRVKSFGGHKPSFAIVVVSVQDPAETVFIRMLTDRQGEKCTVVNGKSVCCPAETTTETEREGHARAPLTLPAAFPVFGRGRVLDGLSEKDLSKENVDAACKYLLGKCSCEIKAQNPGRDLLFSVPWNDRVEMTISDVKPPPELPTGLGDLFWPGEDDRVKDGGGGVRKE